MVRISVEVRTESTHFRVAVWAGGIEQALSLTKACYPGGAAKVIFPVEPEAFFVKGIPPVSGVVQSEMPEEVAG